MKHSTILLIISAAFIQGCKSKGEINQTSTLRYGVMTDLVTLDPGKCDDAPSYAIISQCLEGLTKFNERGETIPSLAEKIEHSKDGKNYTFHIKKGVKFHNGDELTAEDFRWTFKRNLNKKLNSSTALSFLGDIVGAEEYSKGIVDEVKGIRVINPYTLEINIKEPKGYFLSKLAYTTTFVLNRKLSPETEITQKKDFIGTGPFKLVERKNKDYTKLSAHTEYHDQKSNINNIEYFVVSDGSMMINKIKKGALDIAEINTTEVNPLKQDHSLSENLLEVVNSGISYLEFNPNKLALFKNPKFRLAIAHAINQEETVKEVLDENAIAAHYLIPQDILGFRSGKGSVPFDVKRAKELLKEANIDPKTVTIQITVSNKGSGRKVSENLSVQLRKNLGIDVKVQGMSWDAYIAKIDKQEIPLRLAGWSLDYPDPSNILSSLFDSTSTRNRCGFNNPVFDSLTRKADKLTSSQERVELYQKAEDILLEEGIIIPLFTPKRYWWINPKVKNLEVNARGHLPFNKILLK